MKKLKEVIKSSTGTKKDVLRVLYKELKINPFRDKIILKKVDNDIIYIAEIKNIKFPLISVKIYYCFLEKTLKDEFFIKV